MNKYQKALNNLEDIICELSCELKQDYELYTRETGYEKYIYILQELVDKTNKYDEKETAKKPIKEIIFDAYDCDDRNIDFEWERTKCPHCDDDLINEYEDRDFEDYDYCPCCGGRLDWGNE